MGRFRQHFIVVSTQASSNVFVALAAWQRPTNFHKNFRARRKNRTQVHFALQTALQTCWVQIRLLWTFLVTTWLNLACVGAKDGTLWQSLSLWILPYQLLQEVLLCPRSFTSLILACILVDGVDWIAVDLLPTTKYWATPSEWFGRPNQSWQSE